MKFNACHADRKLERAYAVRDATEDWLSQFDGDLTHFVALTFDAKKIDSLINSNPRYSSRRDDELVDMYSRSMRHFLKRLQRKLYGNMACDGRSPLLVVPVLEGLREIEVPHYHCYFGVSAERHAVLECVVRDCWSKVQFAGQQIHVQGYRDRGCLNYGAKQATSLHRRNVDWLNVVKPN